MVVYNKRILCIDSDEIALKIVVKILEAAGYDVLSVQTVQEAKDIINNSLPHLVVASLELKSGSGHEVLKYIHTNPVLKSIPAIAISKFDSKKEMALARKNGVKEYLVKPVNAVKLKQFTKEYLKDSCLRSISFSPEDMPELNASLQCEIVRIGELECQISAKVKIQPCKVSLDAELFSTLKLDNAFTEVKSKSTSGDGVGYYYTSISLLGLKEEVFSNIRKVASKWSV
jgi:twitching motility two-component system response regulator PilH